MYVIRQHVREEVSIEARLIIPATVLSVIPCRMLDLSPQGTKVRIGIDYELPSQIFLIRDDNEVLFSCSTRWQEQRVAGLMFIDLGTRSERKRILRDLPSAIVLGPRVEEDAPAATEPAATTTSEVAPPPAAPPLQR
jgi:hypothetical protein